MAVRIYTTRAGSELCPAEVSLLRRLVDERGRAALIAPSFAEADVCRHDLARAGVALGVDYATPARWTDALWGLLGDGRRMVDNLERQLVISDMLFRRTPEELAPLGNTPGTVRMLGRMARDLLPGIAGTAAGRASAVPAVLYAGESAAEKKVAELLRAYADALDCRGLVEPSEAAEVLAASTSAQLPACARTVVVRGVTSWSHSFLRLLGAVAVAGGDVHILLACEQAACVDDLSAALEALGAAVSRSELGEGDGPAVADDDAVPSCVPRLLEVSGPHARARAYTDAIEALVDGVPASRPQDGVGAAPVPRVLVVAPDAAGLFAELAPRLAVRGMTAAATDFVPFGRTAVGGRFTALADLAECMKDAEEGRAAKAEWWPAPELTDWIYSPVSGADAARARQFDKNMRLSRAKTVDGVMSLLQSIQGQVRSDRKKLDADHPLKNVPCVVYDVFQAIWRAQPVKALKAMLSVAEALPDRSFGSADGQVRREAELAHARRAVQVLTETTRELDVSQASAVPVLAGVRVAVREQSRGVPAAAGVAVNGAASGEVQGAPAPRARVDFVSLRDAAVLRPGAYHAVLFADVDLDSYPLSHEEGPLATLAAALGRTGVTLEPAAQLRVQFSRAARASRTRAVLARVTHDRQARDRYPAAIWTELHARAEAAGAADVETAGEGDIVADFDPAAGEGLERRIVSCEAPQHLSAAAVPYLVLRRRANGEPGAPLVPRLTSASQIEAYSDCPLCWFVSYRVKPQSIDAGFGGMEKGNFVHDVLEHLHAQLPREGMERVTPENLPRAQELLHRVFDETLAEHAAKRGAEGPLVPISPVEERQVAEILPQLEGVLAYEAEAITPFVPRYLEFSFNDLGVEYAGWPLGGRIDRVDVDAENRAVVIDYKHRAGVEEFKLADPTVVDEKTGAAAADDPRWLPPHTQTLIYAQAMRRALGLDTRAALYFSTKGGKPAMRGAASAELLEEEHGDGRIPGLKKGFPGEGGGMDFDQLLDRVEAGIAERLDELERGIVAAAEEPTGRCPYNHGDAFMRRDA